MGVRHDLEGLNRQIDRAAGGVGGWAEVADALRSALGARNAFLRIHNNDGSPGAIESTRTAVDQRRRRDYTEHYWTIDFSLRSLLKQPSAKIVHLGAMRANPVLAKSEYYVDWLSHYDVDHMIDCLAPIANGMFIRFGVTRSTGEQPFHPGDVQTVSDLVPVLQRAFRLRPLTLGNRLRLDSALDLDLMSEPVVILGADGEVSAANLSAQLIAARRSGISLSGGEVRCEDRRADAGLASLVASVACSDRPAVAGEVRIAGPERDQGLTVVVARVPVAGSGELRTVLLLGEPSRARPCGKVDFSRWGLTPKESELAAVMMEGARLVYAAKQLNITHETARFHLKNIYSKLGVHSQSGLVRRLITDEQGATDVETFRAD
jgi:DNA-binding CsgD family transcriptional regulator